MEKCKFCQADLEEGVTLCPVCGKDNAEAAPEAEEMTAPEAAEETAAGTTQEAPETAEVPAEQEAPQETSEIKPGVQATPGKIAIAAAAVVVLLALLIGLLIFGMDSGKEGDTVPVTTAPSMQVPGETEEAVPATVPADGNPDDVTCKGSYTVTEEELLEKKDVVVAKVGDAELTNGMLQTYYWDYFMSNYYTFAMYYGMDPISPLDTQVAAGANMTWQQVFLQYALMNWQQYQTMSQAAKDAGMTLSQEDLEFLEGLEASLSESAANNGMTLEELLKSSLGAAADIESYKAYREDILWADLFFATETAKLVPTEEEVEEFYNANEQEFLNNGIDKEAVTVDVRHILLVPEGGTVGEDGATTYSEEEWKACEAAAQEILDQWLAGDKTEESFAELANTHSTDPGSNTNGGLYEDVFVGQMVPEFNDWCFDASRKFGDYGLVKTSYGYHVMFYVGSELVWKQEAERSWISDKTMAMLTELVEKSPMEVEYEKIVIGPIDLG